MTNKIIINGPSEGFETIKKVDENGVEFWTARELMGLLGYFQWRNFEEVVNKSKKACLNSAQSIKNHFVDTSKMVHIGSETMRKVNDYKLDRYACYLIAQNSTTSRGFTFWSIQ